MRLNTLAKTVTLPSLIRKLKMMIVMNATNSVILFEKGRFGIMATSILLGLISAASGAYAQETGQKSSQHGTEPVAQKRAEIAAFEKLMVEADALVKSGKPADAYILLEPLEFEHSGEARFDYLIGIAALDSGKPDKATLAFERALAVNPDFAAARLDMARAYYQLGDLLRAKTEFIAVLKQNPSAEASDNIKKYLDEIAAQEAGKQTRFTGYVEGTAGYDSNVNYSTSQSQIFVDANAANITLNPNSVKQSDNYYAVAAGGEATHSLNTNWNLYAGADLRQRGNHTQKSFDTLDLDVRAGVMFGANANRLRIGVLGGRYNLDNSHNSDTAGLNGEWHHEYSPSNHLRLFGKYAQYRFVDADMQANDYDQQAIGGGWLHVLVDGKSTLFGSLYYGTEKDVGGRTDGPKRFSGFRVGVQTAFSDKTTLFINAGGQVGDYSKVNQYFLRLRSDRLYDLTAGATWHLDKLWTLRPQMNYSKNNSNIAIYGYNRTAVSLTVRRDFR
jgi:outer membrane protein